MMNTRRTERIAGALFIVATVSSALGFGLLKPVLEDLDVLASVAANEVIVKGLNGSSDPVDVSHVVDTGMMRTA